MTIEKNCDILLVTPRKRGVDPPVSHRERAVGASPRDRVFEGRFGAVQGKGAIGFCVVCNVAPR